MHSFAAKAAGGKSYAKIVFDDAHKQPLAAHLLEKEIKSTPLPVHRNLEWNKQQLSQSGKGAHKSQNSR